jgi:hypothetical protein
LNVFGAEVSRYEILPPRVPAVRDSGFVSAGAFDAGGEPQPDRMQQIKRNRPTARLRRNIVDLRIELPISGVALLSLVSFGA